MPVGLIALNVGMPVGAWTNKKYGPKLTTLVGCSLMVLGTFLGSYMTRLAPFMLCYSLLAGFGTGMSYSTPMQAGWTWFPNSKGFINGLTLFGFGFGAFIFNKIGTNLYAGGMPWGAMIRRLVCIYSPIILSGALLVGAKPAPVDSAAEAGAGAGGAAVAASQVAVAAPPADEECDVAESMVAVPVSPPEGCDPPGAGFTEAVRSRRFLVLWLLGLCTFTPGLTTLGLYKRFAMTSGGVVAVDKFASFVGGLGSIANGLGRVFWGNMVDKIGFQRGFNTTTLLSILILLLTPLTVGSKLAFGAAISGILFCLGGSIAMFVTVNAQTFGTRNAGEIYSVLFSSFALSSIFGAKLVMRFLPAVGWGGIFKLLATMSTCALGLLALLRAESQKPAPWEDAA
jgi:OFA family oxalate/formate antiporter-like MFS transporter